MDKMVACPDCGTPNRADADLCAQCWHALSDDVLSKIPVAAFASSGSIAPPPPPLQAPRAVQAPRPAPEPEPVTPREATPGPVPYFVAAGAGGPNTAFIPAPQPVSAPATTSSSAPLGTLVALALVLAVLGGGYYFFFGRSSSTFSPEDGAYSVTLPGDWEPIVDVSDAHPHIDVVVGTDSSAVLVGHVESPSPVSAEQLRAGAGFAELFMPQFPGMSSWNVQESALLGDGVTAFEMTSSMDLGVLVPGAGRGEVRAVLAGNGSPTLAVLVVACPEAECSTADAAFEQMAQTFEFSS